MTFKHNYSFVFFVVFSLLHTICYGQKKNYFNVEVGGAAATSNFIPFWLQSNQHGDFTGGSPAFLSRFTLGKPESNTNNFDWSWKASGIYSNANQNRFRADELFAAVRLDALSFSIGKQREKTFFGGISSTNGNILFSQNARPFPAFKLELNRYVDVPLTKGWLSFKGHWREGILNDSRYVKNTLVHNKFILLKWGKSSIFHLETGLEHFVQWGGDSFSRGALPQGFKDYLRIISGREGKTFETINALGNHIGNYHINAHWKRSGHHLKLFIQHFFEDRSGREWDNWPDGLYGISWDRGKSDGYPCKLIYEFYFSKNQSGPLHNDETGGILSGDDDYFSHGIYRSGWKYFGRTIGSPFFKPYPYKDFETIDTSLRNGDGGIENSRLVAHHVGFSGNWENWSYRSMASWTLNWGRFQDPYSSRKDQFSFLTEMIWESKNGDFEIRTALAIDRGDLYPNSFGGMLKVIRNFNF